MHFTTASKLDFFDYCHTNTSGLKLFFFFSYITLLNTFKSNLFMLYMVFQPTF